MVTDGEKKLVYRAASDRYYYFDSLPEARDVYSERSGECAELREALDAYRQKDRNESGESRTYEPVTKTHRTTLGAWIKHCSAMRSARPSGTLPHRFELTMELFVAIDSGGQQDGSPAVRRSRKNTWAACAVRAPTPTDIGRDEAVRRVNILLGQLLSNPESEVASLYGAMAGEIPNGDVFSDVIREKFGIELVRIEDDGCCIITGNLGRADGCALVCGTGSSLFVRRAGEKLRHIGGKGYLIDTGGSGFELGREALRAALRAFDGRGQPTVLTELLSERLGRKTDDGIIPMVHRGGRAFIASLSERCSKVLPGR